MDFDFGSTRSLLDFLYILPSTSCITNWLLCLWRVPTILLHGFFPCMALLLPLASFLQFWPFLNHTRFTPLLQSCVMYHFLTGHLTITSISLTLQHTFVGFIYLFLCYASGGPRVRSPRSSSPVATCNNLPHNLHDSSSSALHVVPLPS